MTMGEPEVVAKRIVGLPVIDAIGAGLFAALIGWTLLVGQITERDPLPMAVLVAVTGGTAFLARHLTRYSNVVVPKLLLGTLVGAVIVSWPAGIHPHFGLTGYANANGALYVIGVGAAGLIMLRTSPSWRRYAAAGAGLFLAALPAIFGSDAASGAGLVVLATIGFLLIRRGDPPRALIPISAAVAVLVLVGTVVAGLVYSGDGEGDGGWRLTERRLVLWSESAQMLIDNPVTGVGPGAFGDLSPTALRDRDARWAHHAPLQVGAETGVIGLTLLLGVLVWAFVWLYRGSARRGSALATVVLALSLAHASIDFVWHHPAVTVALAAVIGAGATAGAPSPD